MIVDHIHKFIIIIGYFGSKHMLEVVTKRQRGRGERRRLKDMISFSRLE